MKKHSTNDTATHLLSWFEVVGTYNGFLVTEGFLHLKISNKMFTFPKDSVEAQYIQEMLNDTQVGQRIGVLRTDISEKPIRFRLVDSPSQGMK